MSAFATYSIAADAETASVSNTTTNSRWCRIDLLSENGRWIPRNRVIFIENDTFDDFYSFVLATRREFRRVLWRFLLSFARRFL